MKFLSINWIFDTFEIWINNIYDNTFVFKQLISQQKETDPDEYKKLISEKDTNTKRIQQLTEETGKLKTEVAR